MRGQLSAEMLIILAVIVAVALLLASQMMKSAGTASQKVEQGTGAIFNKTDAAAGTGRGAPGEYCSQNSECASGSCNTYTYKCN